MNSPCKGCADRHTACHDRCERYAKWKAKVREQAAAEREYILRRREDFLRSELCECPKNKRRIGKEHGEQ